MWDDPGYETPEGHFLHKRLLLPEVLDFTELFTYVREWDFATMNHHNGVRPSPELVPEDIDIDGNRFTPYCTLRMGMQPSRRDWRSIAVIPTDLTIQALTGELVTIDDSLSTEVIEHVDRGRALVVIKHNQIIGSRYLAYVDPATVPARPA